MSTHLRILFTLFLVLATTVHAEPVYEQIEDHVFADIHGLALTMDIFIPTGEKNGAAIVDIASGAWFSDRGKIRDHKMARFYDIFCGRGYTVFAVRPGSVTKFTADEMVANVNRAIRYVKANAGEYGINLERIGLTGASAGGHLACLTVVREKTGDPNATDSLKRFGTEVQAVGVFFPPTNFLEWGDEGEPDFSRQGTLFFNGGLDGRSVEEVRAQARRVSPALNIERKTPPFLIWHGDADPLVPLQQSEFLVERLKAVGTDVEFYIKEGGGHPWLTIHEEVAKMADWFDTKLESK